MLGRRLLKTIDDKDLSDRLKEYKRKKEEENKDDKELICSDRSRIHIKKVA